MDRTFCPGDTVRWTAADGILKRTGRYQVLAVRDQQMVLVRLGRSSTVVREGDTFIWWNMGKPFKSVQEGCG
jgi:hypothetical protein